MYHETNQTLSTSNDSTSAHVQPKQELGLSQSSNSSCKAFCWPVISAAAWPLRPSALAAAAASSAAPLLPAAAAAWAPAFLSEMVAVPCPAGSKHSRSPVAAFSARSGGRSPDRA